MSLELWSTTASIGTFVVIGATARERGVCLLGLSLLELPKPPYGDIVDAALKDLNWAWQRVDADPAYAVLNSCRTYLTVEQQLMTSKSGSGRVGDFEFTVTI